MAVPQLRRAFACAAIVGALTCPAAASAAWSTPGTLSGTGAGAPQVAADSMGRGLAVWMQDMGTHRAVMARMTFPSGFRSAVQQLSASGVDSAYPHVAMNGNGLAVVAWRSTESGGVIRNRVRFRNSDGTLGPNMIAGLAGDYDPQVAIDSTGKATVVWDQLYSGTMQIYGRTFTSSAAAGNAQILSVPGQDNFQPALAGGPGGTAVAAWESFDGTYVRIRARRRAVDGTRGPATWLSSPGVDGQDPSVAINASGDAYVAWSRGSSPPTVMGRVYSAGNVLSGQQQIGTNGDNPDAALADDGTAIVALNRFDGSVFRTALRRRSAAGVLGSLRDVSPAGMNAAYPAVALRSDGIALAAWLDGTGTDTFRQLPDLTGTRTTVDAQGASDPPDVAVGGSSYAHAVWTQLSNGTTVVRGAMNPAPEPLPTR